MKKLVAVLMFGVGIVGTAFGQTNIAGTLYASNFAQWRVARGNTGPYSWSSPTACTVSSGGATFPAFRVGAPVRIVDADPSLSETVIPSAVTVSGSGCSITIAPSHQHNSFNFQTATAGLQEAINYSFSLVLPGMIYVTPDFAVLGGTTATITNAKGSAAITIQDARTAVIVPYMWDGVSAYVARPFGGGGTVDPATIPLPKAYYPTATARVAPNPINTANALGDEVTKSTNGEQVAGIGANTTINQTLANTSGAVRSLTVPANYAGSDVFSQVSTQSASGAVNVCGGFGCTIGQLQSITPLNKGSYPSCPTTTTLNQPPVSGASAVVTPVCTLVGSRYQVTSYTISNSTGVYANDNPNFTVTGPNPPANAPFLMIDQTNGAQAKGPVTYVRDFCHVLPASVNDTSVDNVDCVLAAMAEANRRANALGLGNTQPHISFAGGDYYRFGHYTTFVRASADDGSAPSGNCNGVPCVAMAPLAPALIPCMIPVQSNMIVDLAGANIGGPWSGNTLDLTDGTMFCGDMFNGGFSGPGYITNTAVAWIIPHNFQKGYIDKSILTSNVGATALIFVQDRSILGDITTTGLTGVVIGGLYTSRRADQVSAEGSGYCDTCNIRGIWIFNEIGTYDDVAHPITSNQIPDRCTGVTPSGHVSMLHQFDRWFDYNVSVSCVNPTHATNTTAVNGLTFQTFTIGSAGNSETLTVEATTHSAFPYSTSGSNTTIYALNADGTNRTLQSLADEIDGLDGIKGSGAKGGFRVNITGTPSSTFGAHAITSYSGGTNSPRLADGDEPVPYPGAAGHGLFIYSRRDRPSNGVDLPNFQCEGELRGCVTIASAVNGLEALHISSEGPALCNAGSGVVFGTPECPDPYNFYTSISGSAVAPRNTAALELNGPETTGHVAEVDGYAAYNLPISGGIAVSADRVISSQINLQLTQQVTQPCTPTALKGCPGKPQVVNYQVLFGNPKNNEVTNQLIVDPTTNMDIVVIGEQTGQMVGIPNQGAVGAPGFVNITSTPPTQFPFTAIPYSTYGLSADPPNVPKSFFYYNNLIDSYRLNTGTQLSPLWTTLAKIGVTPEVAPGGTYTVTAADIGRRIFFQNGGTLNLGLIAGVDGVPEGRFEISVYNGGGSPVTVNQTAGGGGGTGIPATITSGASYTFWTFVVGHTIGQWLAEEWKQDQTFHSVTVLGVADGCATFATGVLGSTGVACGSGGGMVYPGAGIAVSTGSAWSPSLTAPAGTIVGTTDTQTLTNKTVDGVTPTVFGYLDASSSIQGQLNAKQAAITLTTTGTSGVATFTGSTLNIPNYSFSGITGSGTTGFIPKWTSSTAQGNSACDDGQTTASVFTCSEGIAVNASGVPSQIDLTPSGTSPATTSGAASLGVPNTVTTAGVYLLPAAPASGIWHASNASGIVTDTISPVSLTADVSGVLPAANGGTGTTSYAPILSGTTGSIGGAIAVGSCDTGTATVTGATTSMVAVADATTSGAPGFSATGAFQVSAQVTAANTVTVSVCAILGATPTPSSSTYLVRVIP